MFRIVDKSEATRVAALAGPKKYVGARKYRNVPVIVDGRRFASKLEARRYGELKLMERNGEIAELTMQPSYPLVVKNVRVATYLGDFSYVVVATGERVTEDAKGFATPLYRLKKKLMKVLHGIEIREVR